MKKNYVHYGCGQAAPTEWYNFDVSPTLRLQKMPILGNLLKNQLNVIFPSNVHYGNIIKGLPVADNTCDGVYCSHTLEHLALQDFRAALKNTYSMMKTGGIFRCVVPDLEFAAKKYLADLAKGDAQASMQFVGPNTLLGMENRPKGLKGIVVSVLGNSHHQWMWDYASLSQELANAGFRNIRPCQFNDSSDSMFTAVEEAARFVNAVAIESQK
jgi:SAM-dependent methyltransferase